MRKPQQMWEALVSTDYTWPWRDGVASTYVLVVQGVMTTASAFPHAAEQRASCASPQEVLAELLPAKRSAAEAHLQVRAADA